MTNDLSKQSLIKLRDEKKDEDFISSNIIEIWTTKVKKKGIVEAAFVIGTAFQCTKEGCTCGGWESNFLPAQSQGGINYLRSIKSYDLNQMQ